MIPIAGYADRWSVGQGETMQFKVSSSFTQPYSARMVRIVCADPNPDGPGILEEDYSSVFSGQFPSRIQNVQLGSYASVDAAHRFASLTKFAVVANIWPTLPEAGPQSILSLLDSAGSPLIELGIGQTGRLTASITGRGVDRQVFEMPDSELAGRRWYTVWLGVDVADCRISLDRQALEAQFGTHTEQTEEFECAAVPDLTEVDRLLIAASGEGGLDRFYNGKIEKPCVVKVIPDSESDLSHLSGEAGVVGFSAQGDFQGAYYRRNSQLPSEYEWVFEGIDDEILGDFGLNGGGAAGFELDRVDYSLGTSDNTVVLASSETYPDHFVLVPEEILTHLSTRAGDPVSELIRSDMVLFETGQVG
ncbi:MAG: hypothetical protein OXI60_02235 [Acidiferrobacterales bacterium]|nr:hypothetical protein [Acidiferrobacterales bacterium]